jgi:hypothetical protein
MPPQSPNSSDVPPINENPNGWWDKSKPFVEIAGIVLLAVYTFFTIRMYYANKEAADAANSAATTASSALQSSGQSFQQEQRAYIAPTQAMMSNPPLCEIPGRPRVCADVHVANSGRTPAIGVRLRRYLTFGEHAESTIKQMPIPEYKTPDGGALGNIGDQWGTAFSDPIGDAGLEKRLLDGSIPVYIYGVVQYFDIFGNYHETGFCYERVLRGSNFISCGYGNWLDKRPQ